MTNTSTVILLEGLIKENKETIGVLSINPSEVTLLATKQLRANNEAITIILELLKKLEEFSPL